MKGYVQSIESFSTLDGPGTRSVVFLQGCPLRCLYCHNPETWICRKEFLTDSSDIIRKVSRNINYISKDGGVTISGGEPLYQPEFLKELLSGFKSMGLHTAVDTSGYASVEDAIKIIDLTDLFIVDIKHMDPAASSYLTGRSSKRMFEFIEFLDSHKKSIWIRCVMVRGITDDLKHIKMLADYVKKLDSVEILEILPYHDMAKEKYKKLNLDYKLKNLPSYCIEDIKNIKYVLRDQLSCKNVI